ncbi:MAG: PQQ-binding-like beta-propeller repeat protein, partial [Planctomycetota bacterium]
MLDAVTARRALRAGMLFLLSVALATAVVAGEGDGERLARQILDATGVRGGLIVHLGCGDGTLTAALRADDSYVVHGLDTDAGAVRRAREQIRKRGLYGPVAVERLAGTRLPYADNLANLVVAERPGEVTAQEAMRVLAPGGVLYARQNGDWTKTVKARPENTDEWTHFLHDPSGNAVAHDQVVGPPGRVQWIAPPRHTRSHEHIPSINALVATGGRIFYVADQGPIRSVGEPADWHLVARDAYNGLLLWKRPFSPWFPHIVNWGHTPRHLQRRLVAVGDRLYVTLGLHAPLSAVDAATGETLKVYGDTQGTEEVLCHQGILLLGIRRVTDEREAQLEKMMKLTRRERSPLFERDSAQPIVKRFRQTRWQAQPSLVALEAATGRVLWKKTGQEAGGLRPGTLCAVGDRVFCQRGGNTVCLDLETGGEVWSRAAGRLRVACETCVVCAGGEHVAALSAETGKPLWRQEATLCNIRDVFVVNGSVWLGGFRPYQGRRKGKRGPAWGPYFAVERELATGKLLQQVEPENPGHHHRCWRNKATDRYILAGRRGVEFIDLETGEYRWHNWVRGVCRYGVMPANGLLYAPPHPCFCYPG